MLCLSQASISQQTLYGVGSSCVPQPGTRAGGGSLTGTGRGMFRDHSDTGISERKKRS